MSAAVIQGYGFWRAGASAGLTLALLGCNAHPPGPVAPTVGSGDPPAVNVPATAADWSCLRENGKALGIPVAPPCSNGVRLTARPSAASATALLPAPLKLSAVVDGRTVTLSWSASGPVTSYIIEVGYPGTGIPADVGIFDTMSTATTLMVMRVTPGRYVVGVRARNGAEVSPLSNQVFVSVVDCGSLFTAVPPPTNLEVLGRGSNVTLTWTAGLPGCPPSEYVIEAGSAHLASDIANFRTGSPATWYDATNVSPGTYYIRVRAASGPVLSLYPGFEVALVVGSGLCDYSVNPTVGQFSTLGSGTPGSLKVNTDSTCSWTVSSDLVAFFHGSFAFSFSLSGPQSLAMQVGPNTSGPVRRGTVFIRWSDGGFDMPVLQNGRLP